MIHMELGPSTVLGVGLAMVGFLLYVLRIRKPDVSRDYDLFFSSVGLLCGGILLFQGWRLDPILLLCQVLLSGTVIFFVGETLWLRSLQRTISDKKIGAQEYTHTQESVHQITSFEVFDTLDLKSSYATIKLLPTMLAVPDWEGIDFTPPIDYS